MLIKTYMLDLKQIWDVWEIWDIFKFMYLTLIFPELDCIIQNASFFLGASLDIYGRVCTGGERTCFVGSLCKYYIQYI